MTYWLVSADINVTLFLQNLSFTYFSHQCCIVISSAKQKGSPIKLQNSAENDNCEKIISLKSSFILLKKGA